MASPPRSAAGWFGIVSAPRHGTASQQVVAVCRSVSSDELNSTRPWFRLQRYRIVSFGRSSSSSSNSFIIRAELYESSLRRRCRRSVCVKCRSFSAIEWLVIIACGSLIVCRRRPVSPSIPCIIVILLINCTKCVTTVVQVRIRSGGQWRGEDWDENWIELN